MKIKIYVDSVGYSALHIWDFYFAYRQAENRRQSYISDVEIVFDTSTKMEIDNSCINVGWFYMPDTVKDTADRFDFIIVDGQHHHLEVCTEAMFNTLVNRPNCYFVTGSYLPRDHLYFHQTIFAPMILNSLAYFTRPFYPQYFERNIASTYRHRQKTIIFINGQNRVHREYFIRELQKNLPELPIINNFNDKLEKLNDSFFETEEDTVFREMLNSTIENFDYVDLENKDRYYGNSVEIGIGGNHGKIAPGYFITDHYYQYHCIIFPETPWLNDEIFLTEKIMKCFISRSIPWPIGGSRTHELYNELGYQTAWNLLPDNFKSFDLEKNHAQRYALQALAIKWAYENPDIWSSPKAQDIRKQNYDNFFCNTHDSSCAKKLHEIIKNTNKF